MGTLADSLFNVLMSWVRALVSGIWALFSSEHTTVLEFLGKNWMMIAVVLIAAGLVIDWLIWLIRWQPYHIWAQRVRRLLRLEDEDIPDEEDEQEEAPAFDETYLPLEPQAQEEPEEDAGELFIDEREAQAAMERADGVPDEELGVYPGMRYGTAAQGATLGQTQRFSALTAEGPGSAEVARRRAEIDAWQQQMQEEARARAQAERAARIAEEERLAREAAEAEVARIAEEERLAREAAEAEAARIAEEERLAREAAEAEAARIAEEERLAQEEYARQLAEYEIQKAQYERELARYELEKAAYDAQMAELAAQRAAQETAQELAPQGAPRRRRAAPKSCSDYIAGDEVTELPAPPAWPQAGSSAAEPRARKAGAKPVARKSGAGAARPGAHKPGAKPAAKQTGRKPEQNAEKKAAPAKEKTGLLGRMARMLEPQEEELSSLKALPPRVDMHEAYRPAKTPQKTGRRNG